MPQNNNTDKLIGTVLDGRYQILRKIGEGGMARVYKALDIRLNREVAVKVMREELFLDVPSRRAFYTEAHAVAKLSHPNIVSIYDVNNSVNSEYIVMELLEGVTLRQYIDKMRPIPWKQVLHFSKQISNALIHAHSKGIIHRDIKPQNIMLSTNGDLKVADFGIAAMENELDSDSGRAIGSLNYIAPEQLRGAPASPKGDVYSLGIVMYEMLTGFKPYTGRTPAEVLIKLSGSEILPVRAFEQSIPKELETIVSRAMSPDMDLRYTSAQELFDALNRFTEKVLTGGKKKPVDDYAEDDPLPKLKVEVKPKVKMPSKIDYFRSARRTGRITFSLGTFAIMGLIILAFSGLWQFWLKDVFSEAVRIELPGFTGYSCESVINNVELASQYNFSVEYVVNTDTAAGTILSQEPAAGRSLMVTEDGIDVKLFVSTGYVMLQVNDVTGLDYREAALLLQNAGFNVEITNVTSSEVDKDVVISTSPSAGEQITSGSTVYVNVSGGPSLAYVSVPNVVGLPEDAAIAKLEASGLSCAGTVRETSDYDAGTVIGQSKAAFTETEEHSGITLTVSSGPWG
ncbi:MAG: Stk1 family PASTA domain-containing Ser/Thr kinase [Eubacteriales bacterium]|nr:Stk1 family PASTA domain-containing Ser/Thr kinase [Eubacteriales bacterium]